MLQIESVEYKNLFSTGNQTTVIDFTKGRNTLIVGKNGSGKSTISSALIYALYGKDFRGVKKDGLVNSINKKKLVTTCKFKKNGKSYKIVRGIKPDILEIYENGELLKAESSKAEQQSFFEDNILQFPYDSFKQIVVTGSGQYIPFMKLSTPKRRDFIENLLQLGIFSLMQQRLKDYLDSEKTNEKDLKNSIYLNFEKVKIIQSEIDAKKEKSQEKIQQLNSEIELIDIKVADIERQIFQVEGNVKLLEEKLETVTNSPYYGTNNSLSSEKYSVDNDLLKINRFINQIEHIENCPTCRQRVTVEYKEQIKTSYTDEISSLECKITDLEEKISKVTRLQEVETKVIQKINDFNKAIISLQNNVKLENNNKSYIQNQIAEILKDQGEVNTDMEEIKNQLILDKKSLESVTENLALYNYAGLILKDTGIKATIIKEYVGIINELVNNYLEQFDFFVDFTIDENFNETIRSRFRDKFTYENFSEGEKARIDLALLCTFREIAKRQSNLDCNLLILDEIFSSELDFDGVDQLRLCLQSMEDVNIVAISHDQTLIEKDWDRIVRFEKEGNFSIMKDLTV